MGEKAHVELPFVFCLVYHFLTAGKIFSLHKDVFGRGQKTLNLLGVFYDMKDKDRDIRIV
ncbi:MAG: hypothetical protein ACFNUI_05740 [Negativicutes bacterium]